MYVLDEPSIGLHPRDDERLLDALFGLRDLGNSVIVVEHDRTTIERADHLVDSVLLRRLPIRTGPSVAVRRVSAKGSHITAPGTAACQPTGLLLEAVLGDCLHVWRNGDDIDLQWRNDNVITLPDTEELNALDLGYDLDIC